MKRLLLIGAIAATTSANAVVIAYWNFNGTTTTVDPNGIVKNADIGTATFFTTGGRANKVQYNSASTFGTTENALNSDPAGTGIRLRDKVDGRSFVMDGLDFTNLEDVSISFAFSAEDNDLFTFAVDYSLDAGANWVNAVANTGYTTGTAPTVFDVETISLASVTAIEGQSSVLLRFSNIDTANGGVSFGFDNLQVLATPVPEPSTFAMIAGALALGVVMYRRR